MVHPEIVVVRIKFSIKKNRFDNKSSRQQFGNGELARFFGRGNIETFSHLQTYAS
jgi:hypothetical protein